MLSNEAKKKLRTLAHETPSMLQIGKTGLSENMISNLSEDLRAHELVKVTLLKTAEISVREAAIECAAATGSEIVQIVGRVFLLYKRSKDNKLEIPA